MSDLKYGSLREKIAAEKRSRTERYATFAAVFAKARAAGLAAGEAAVPQAMMVVQPSSNPHVPKAMWHVPEGACGFAWVHITPGNCPFANWLKKNNLARSAYKGGVEIWISDFGQSIARKEAFAHAMAEILRDQLGIHAYAGSRLD
jgi:hypothetical protein